MHFAYIGHPLLGDSLYGFESGSSCNALCGGFGNNGFGLCGDLGDLEDGITGVESDGFSDLDDVSNLHDGIHGEVSAGVDLNGVMPGQLSVGVNKCDVEKSRADLINHQALQSNRVCFIHPISKKVIDICLKIDGIYKELFE